jgi:hypothetical protein
MAAEAPAAAAEACTAVTPEAAAAHAGVRGDGHQRNREEQRRRDGDAGRQCRARMPERG